MAPNNPLPDNESQQQPASSSAMPNEFFDDASFKTLYGGVVVTWVTTSVIADVWTIENLQMLGLIVALVVAFIGYFVSQERSLKKLVITPFNGLLIYLTIMGGTSYMPSPTGPTISPGEATVAEIATDDTISFPDAEPPANRPVQTGSSFFRPWIINRDLIQQTTELQQENRNLEIQTSIYRTKLDSARNVLRQVQMPAEQRERILENLDPVMIRTLDPNRPVTITQ